ncbi:hypothetical protein MIND_00340900 [Mycena indigotica]|uniref:Rho-GAP domain-containing protein n=1 Tax=Mycena indigotica TaxID=2126181 RepID=A0A8H6T2H2_9AGAR|nr:uncharacterized protein MIND_00340900 [Mycena indigotica]KAF7309694.1 hypothetical protein MIND_00340900 [Mycena indigotica]
MLTAVTELYTRLPSDVEKRKAWIYEVPLPAVHHLREALNAVPLDDPVPQEIFAKYDAAVIAATIKLWLLELDPPVALWEGWDEIRKLYPAVGAAAKSENTETETQRVSDLGLALLRLPKVHLFVLDAIISHLRNLIDTTTAEETEEVYITKLALSIGRTLIRPKFESELSIQDRHPTLMFIDLLKNPTMIRDTISKKKRESERKVPLRKRTAPIDMRLSRSRISVGADTKQLLAAQQSRLYRHLLWPNPPPPPPPPILAPTPFVAPPPPPVIAPTPFVPPPPPPALPTVTDRPVFKEPPPETDDDDLPPRPSFKEPRPSSPDATPPRPKFVDPPAEPMSPTRGVASPRSGSPAIEDQNKTSLSRSSSGQAVRGPRGARGPRPPSSGSVSSIVSNLNRKNSIGSSPTSPNYKRNSGSPGRPSSVLGRSAAFSTRTMESDAEDNLVDKK